MIKSHEISYELMTNNHFIHNFPMYNCSTNSTILLVQVLIIGQFCNLSLEYNHESHRNYIVGSRDSVQY